MTALLTDWYDFGNGPVELTFNNLAEMKANLESLHEGGIIKDGIPYKMAMKKLTHSQDYIIDCPY